MPPHAIAGHLAAVLTPIAALLVLAYALRPAARAGLRLPTVLATLAATVACVLSASGGSKLYGQLKAAVTDADLRATALPHAKNADALTVVVVVLAVLLVAAAWTLLAPGRPRTAPRTVLSALLAVVAAASLALTWVTVGDAVASVWAHHLLLAKG